MLRLFRPSRPFWLLLSILVQNSFAQTKTASQTPDTPATPSSARLQEIVARAVKQTLETFAPKKLETNQIAVTLIDLTDPQKPVQAGYRGGEQIYPASVI